MDATDNNGTKDTYYGYIEEIWELDYGTNLKVPLFRCQWVKPSGGGVTKDQYGMTIVDLNNLGYRDEPFVLAQDVAQVFYIKDMSTKPKKGINKQKDEPKRHIDQGRETSLEWRTRQTCQKNIIILLSFHLSK